MVLVTPCVHQVMRHGNKLILFCPFEGTVAEVRCLLFLLCILSAYLEILGFPMGGAY